MEETAGRCSKDDSNIPVQSLLEVQDAAVPVILEVRLDRVVEDLGERDVVQEFLVPVRANFFVVVVIDVISLDHVGAVRACSEQQHERSDNKRSHLRGASTSSFSSRRVVVWSHTDDDTQAAWPLKPLLNADRLRVGRMSHSRIQARVVDPRVQGDSQENVI